MGKGRHHVKGPNLSEKHMLCHVFPNNFKNKLIPKGAKGYSLMTKLLEFGGLILVHCKD